MRASLSNLVHDCGMIRTQLSQRLCEKAQHFASQLVAKWWDNGSHVGSGHQLLALAAGL
ncbi:MAG: hypothetical protein DMG48_00230 [Acidobacteria bacterium]|nr:MAG: hypothetical protein DMG48_00230 [Acidobacteriota bacterium]